MINVLNSENNLLIILKMPEIWSLIVEKWKVQLFNPHSVNKMLLSNLTSLRVSHHCCSYRFFLSYGESLILGIHILLTLLKVQDFLLYSEFELEAVKNWLGIYKYFPFKMVTVTPSDIFDYASPLSSRGDPEDLVLAASLLPDAKIFAALRLSKQATKVTMATSILLSGLSPFGYFLSALCLPCIPLCISGVVDSMKNTLNIITDKGIVTAVVDHKVAGCSPCKTSPCLFQIFQRGNSQLGVLVWFPKLAHGQF